MSVQYVAVLPTKPLYMLIGLFFFFVVFFFGFRGIICCLTSFQTLYTYPENWRAFKAQIAAQYSGARLKVASNPPAFTFGQTNRTPAFVANFPLGKVSI